MAYVPTSFYDYLFDQSPHFDKEILRDWFPTDDAWIGHVATTPWESFTGTQHVYDRVHVGAPDMSQAWQTFDTQGLVQVGTDNPGNQDPSGNVVGENTTGCVANACTPTSISVGWGSSREVYNRERQSYQTNVLCFDQINTRAKAKEQLVQYIKGIKDLTTQIWSDYLRRQSLMKSPTLYICDSRMSTIPLSVSSFTGGMATLNLGSANAVPNSNLSIQYLQRFYEQLQGNGYFKGKYVPNGIFKLITDPITSQQLVQLNPALVSNYKFTDFQKGGELFKYGMSSAIGNFGIAWDKFPARFYHMGNGVLKRVWPFVNVGATIGIKAQFTPDYIAAPYQYSCIWHPEAMKRAVPELTSVHPEMPFLTRDLGGKWNFTGPESDVIIQTGTDQNGVPYSVTIDNKRRNQGYWWTDFEAGIKFEYPEWTVPILHQRDPGCVNDNPACSVQSGYVSQNYSDLNPLCQS